jgi:glycogen debranching enzyme
MFSLISNGAFADSQDPNSTYHHIHRLLANHREHIRDDPWAGLPELTNAEGAPCFDSCDTQGQ